MVGIGRLVDSAGIVKDGKQLHDLDLGSGQLRQSQSVVQDSRPVGDSMNPVPRQGIVFEDCLDEALEIQHPASSQRYAFSFAHRRLQSRIHFLVDLIHLGKRVRVGEGGNQEVAFRHGVDIEKPVDRC